MRGLWKNREILLKAPPVEDCLFYSVPICAMMKMLVLRSGMRSKWNEGGFRPPKGEKIAL